MKTLNQLVVSAVSRSKYALRNADIRNFVERHRPGVTAETVDTIIYNAAKAGHITKIPLAGEVSKFAYTRPLGTSVKSASIASLVRAVLTLDKMDSLEVFLRVENLNPSISKAQVDNALRTMSFAQKNAIKRSKNPMTDTNTVSSQSKFLYSL